MPTNLCGLRDALPTCKIANLSRKAPPKLAPALGSKAGAMLFQLRIQPPANSPSPRRER
jgi:hypothetical protein